MQNTPKAVTDERIPARVNRLKQVTAILSQPVATNDHFDGRDYKYAYEVLKNDVESARAILSVEIGKLEA